MINPFSCNSNGPLKEGELVRVKALMPEGVVLEKTYDVTTCEDIENGVRRMAVKCFYVGKKKVRKR